MSIAERFQAIRASIPQPVEERQIRLPEEIPGYAEWRSDAPHHEWREISKDVWSNGSHILCWTVREPEWGILYSGAQAQAIVQRAEKWTRTRPKETAEASLSRQAGR